MLPVVLCIGSCVGMPTWVAVATRDTENDGTNDVLIDHVHDGQRDKVHDEVPAESPDEVFNEGRDAAQSDPLIASGYHLSGSISLGWRFVGVDGDRGQYAEDLGLDAGPLLRDFSLRGARADDAAVHSFSLDARSLGDPDSSVRGAIDGSLLRGRASWQRNTYQGNAQDDLHPFDYTRERSQLRVETAARGDDDVRAAVEANYGTRDGLSLGTRSVDFGFVSGFPVRRREENYGLGAEVSAPLAGFDVSLDGGLERLDSRDRRNFDSFSPSVPGAPQTEDFAADGESTSKRFGFRARRSFFEGKLSTDFGGRWERTNGENGFDSAESGVFFAPDDPYTRATRGDADVNSKTVDLDAGARYAVDADLAFHVRVRRAEQAQHGTVVRTTALDEGGSTSALTEVQALDYESRASIAEVGSSFAVSDAVDVDLSLSYGRNDERVRETFDDAVQHEFEGTLHEYGGEARVSIEPSNTTTLSLGAGYDLGPTNTAFGQSELTFRNDRGRFAEARLRWRPEVGVVISSTFRHTSRESDAFDSDLVSDAFSVAATVARSPAWNFGGAWSVRVYDYSADTTKVFLVPTPQQVPTTVNFDGVVNLASLWISHPLTSRIEPRLDASFSVSNGDSEFRYGSVHLDVPYRANSRSTFGITIDVHRFAAHDEVSDTDYSSTAFVVYARYDF